MLVLLAAALPDCAAAAPTQIEAFSYRDNRVLAFTADPTGLRAALDTLRSAGGVVTVPTGAYTITRPLTLWPNTTLAGMGWGTEIRLLAPVNTPIRALRVSRHCHVANLTLRGTGYISSDPKAYGATGIIGGADENGGMDSSVVEGCHVTGWNTNGINLAPHSSHNVVKNNTIDSCGWEGIYAAQYDDNNLILGNTITSCRHNAIDVVGSHNVIEANRIRDIGIEIPTSDQDTYGILVFAIAKTTGPISGNAIRENSIENCYEGISVLASNDSDNRVVDIIGNTVLSSRKYGIRVGGSGNAPLPRIKHVRIQSNWIQSSVLDGILLDRIPQAVTVTGNRIFGSGSSGIHASAVEGGTDSLVVEGNVLWKNGAYGADVEDRVTRCTLRGNSFGTNTQGSIRGVARGGIRIEGNREPPPR